MSLGEKSSDRYFSIHLPAPSENMLLAAIAVCFLFLHVLAMVLAPARQSDAAAPLVLAPPSRGD